MRWYIIRTLLHKEWLRHLANKGGLVMMLLLVCAAMLLAFFGKRQGLPANPQLVAGVHVCYVDYWDHSPWIEHWIEHLKSSVPPELERRVRFRPPTRSATLRMARKPTRGAPAPFKSTVATRQRLPDPDRPSGQSGRDGPV